MVAQLAVSGFKKCPTARDEDFLMLEQVTRKSPPIRLHQMSAQRWTAALLRKIGCFSELKFFSLHFQLERELKKFLKVF